MNLIPQVFAGKVDIFVHFKDKRYLIEIKNYRDRGQIKRAKEQLCRYARSEGLSIAYLVIFSEVHSRDKLDTHTEEEAEGITIRSVLVNVNFE